MPTSGHRAAKTWRTAASRVLIAFAVLFGVLALLVVGAMLLVRSEWAERQVESVVSERTGREVDIEGLQVLAAWPPQVELAELRIANPPWAKSPTLLHAHKMSMQFEPAALLRGRLVAHASINDGALSLEKQEKRATWNLGAERGPSGAENEADEGPGRFALRSLDFVQFGIAYLDAKDETDLSVLAKGELGREGQGVQAQAKGRFRGEPLVASAKAPTVPLAGNQPVDVAFEVELAKTRTAGEVTVRATTDGLASLDGHIEASGPSVAALKGVAGTDLPSSAPYRVSARVRYQQEGELTRLDDLKATLGKSDLRGSVSLDASGERPFVRARLESDLFDVEETGIEREAEEELQEKYLLPRDPWPAEALQSLDAEIDLQVKKVRNAEPVPFDALKMRLVLKNSSLQVDPLDIGLASGTVKGRLAFDGRASPEQASIFMDVRGLRLSRLFPEVDQEKAALGRLNGHIELAGRGDTPAELMGNADGRILLAAERGTASGLLVEILGLDAAEVAMLLGKPKNPLPLRCAVVDLKVKNGVARASPFVIDASDTVLSVEGTLHFGKERIDLKARAEPRDASPFTLRTPVNVTGTFLDPKLKPEIGPLAGRAGGAIALAAINPLLALIPFVDPGGDPEGGCQPQKR
jgi:uncharacterized protein involved in outer membrane biogenesis